MTCIAAIKAEDGIYMMADRQASSEYRVRYYCAKPKIFIRSGMLIGMAGSGTDALIVEHRMEFPEHASDEDAFTYLAKRWLPAYREALKEEERITERDGKKIAESVVLIGYQGELFEVDDEFDLVDEREGIAAIGSGHDLAKGSLYTTGLLLGVDLRPQERLRVALTAARRFDVDTGWQDAPDLLHLKAGE